MTQVIPRIESFDHDLEHVPRRIDYLVDVMPVIRVPLRQRGEWDGAAVARARGSRAICRGCCCGPAGGQAGMCLQRRVVCAALYDGLQCKGV